ncbi:tRNA (N6-threonylcarbamoyladenosine(37)-N6)-methyltransferase TrmO [Desulfosporosinus lacus]|uniref:tRNA-Thr(GGU) m(6)t(6)A37 methyltransferase TsaA n=1 Tax=Desulfosporosinus lacus DSM 15449 TaxID=1121420 RepID=A0A1M5Z712_9FIRM|nr:tRNA (N6-threonylcarbamoyladenosine(37)-N6)-methyltransferase TrmO [Desulfosporosinus lacus]SHI20025.1 tRNA-Thr(GGU) m(6)t(6)A37 methyltransferase TsaA [Desulfosporosinus lacus DSM 15449]
MENSITLNPIGIVESSITNRDDMPTNGIQAGIRVFSPYVGALERIEEYSHLWILTWFHQAPRDVTTAVPSKVNPLSHRFGVFALRSPSRPNPVALTLVKLDRIQEYTLYVADMDAIDGTLVIDIKPYFEHDTVFSPRTPQISPLSANALQKTLLKQALTHHGETCPDLLLAVRMALIADKLLGYIKSPDVQVQVYGSTCLADAIQGICRARLANPARFEFCSSFIKHSIWIKGNRRLSISGVRELDLKAFWGLPDYEIFEVAMEEIE